MSEAQQLRKAFLIDSWGDFELKNVLENFLRVKKLLVKNL
jgi:hypothetical protein